MASGLDISLSADEHKSVPVQLPQSQPQRSLPPLDSFSTALVLLPPAAIQSRVNSIRSANDKSFPRWTAHVTLLFPFVQPDLLSEALPVLRDALTRAQLEPFLLALTHVGRFRQREYDTLYLAPSAAHDLTIPGGTAHVNKLRAVLADTMGYRGREFVPHLTLGQAHRSQDAELLEQKGHRLLDFNTGSLEWLVSSVAVLRKDESDGGEMKIYGELLLDPSKPAPEPNIIASPLPVTYHFSRERNSWIPTSTPLTPHPDFRNVRVLSYNVLHDPQHPSAVRFYEIRETLLDIDADVLCLQEVTDDFLRLLLLDDLINSKWSWSSRSPAIPMESERNIALLSKAHLPFSWKRVILGGKHKAAHILALNNVFLNVDRPLSVIIAAIHLTAGLSSQALDTKMKEFQNLIKYLHQNHASDEWIVAGDTNFPTSMELPTDLQDILADVCNASQDASNTSIYEATYDPEKNGLAAQTARSDRSPQRYDRFYVKRAAALRVLSVKVHVLEPGRAASDHWPLSAQFILETSSMQPTTVQLPSRVSKSPRVHNEEDPRDTQLRTFALASGAIPDAEQEQKRECAIDTLCSVIGASREGRVRKITSEAELVDDPTFVSTSSVQLIVVPVGSFALKVHFPDSDVDCIVIGNVSPSTFWTVTKQRIRSQLSRRKHGSEALFLRRFVKDAAVQMMVLEACGIKIDVQYCPATQLVESWSTAGHLSSTDLNVPLPISTLRVLNAHRDRLHIENTVPCLHTFRLAYRSLKLFCLSRGIFTSRFGFIGGIHLSILLCRVAMGLPAEASAWTLVESFLGAYSSFDWTHNVVTLDNVEATYKRSPREPMVILSPVKPSINVSASASASSMETISEEFRTACNKMNQKVDWLTICGTKETAISELISHYDRFIKVDVNYWGKNCMDARALLGYLESRLVHLLVDLHSAVPSLSLRIWPERLSDSPSTGEKSADVQSFYLIGIRQDNPTATEEKPVNNILQSFEESIRKSSQYYDESTTFVSVTEVSRRNIGERVYIEKPVWNDEGLDEWDGSDNEGYEAEALDNEVPEDQFTFRSMSSIKKQQKLSKAKSTPHVPAQKLRTSSDVYNRLMWDTQYDQNDYLIGYEDRFKGVKEMPLREWKRDVDDETFIPFHRVVHFRQKSTGDIVWDRRSKLDLLFNSGVKTPET